MPEIEYGPITVTTGLSDPKITLPFETPVGEMSAVAGRIQEVDGDVSDPEVLPEGVASRYAEASWRYVVRMTEGENWSFGRVLRQFLIAVTGAMVSIALSVGRWVDEDLKKKGNGRIITITRYPQLSTNRVAGAVDRYMPLGWYAFYREYGEGEESFRVYTQPTFVYTLRSLAIPPQGVVFSGLHFEPSPGVEATIAAM